MKQMRVRGASVRSGLFVATVAVSALALFPTAALGADPVTKLFFAPSPIGTEAGVPPGSSVAVTVTARDSAGHPVSGGTVYLSIGGAGIGTAGVGTQRLVAKANPFTTDSHGHVVITYSTPGSYPNGGCDRLKAQNGATQLTSTAIVYDSFCYSPITKLVIGPKPIANQGSLAPNSQVVLTLTLYGANNARLAGGTVWLDFNADNAGSASATVNGVALTKNASAQTADANGQVFITYSVGASPPGSGGDKLDAANNYYLGTIRTSDAYSY